MFHWYGTTVTSLPLDSHSWYSPVSALQKRLFHGNSISSPGEAPAPYSCYFYIPQTSLLY